MEQWSLSHQNRSFRHTAVSLSSHALRSGGYPCKRASTLAKPVRSYDATLEVPVLLIDKILAAGRSLQAGASVITCSRSRSESGQRCAFGVQAANWLCRQRALWRRTATAFQSHPHNVSNLHAHVSSFSEVIL